MNSPATWPSTQALQRARRIGAIALPATILAFLTALPAIPAGATTLDNAAPSATSPVSVSAVSPEKLEEVLAGVPLEALTPAQLKELAKLPGLSSLPTGKLQETLVKTIEELAGNGDTLGQLTNPGELASTLTKKLESLPVLELLGLLKGQELKTLLAGGLGTLSSSELLSELLSHTGKPEALLEQVLNTLSTPQLEGLLGSALKGPVTETTLTQLETLLGISPEGLVEDAKMQLPEATKALTAPLTNGKVMDALDAPLGGLSLLLGSPQEATEESGGSGGSSGGSGGSGGGSGGGQGSSGNGSGGPNGSLSGTPENTTLVVNLPSQGAPAGAAAKAATAKVKVLSWKVKGDQVTVVVQAPAAGTLALSGGKIRTKDGHAIRAERITLHSTLTKAGVASLRKHRNRLQVKLKVSFKPASGASSSVTKTVTLR